MSYQTKKDESDLEKADRAYEFKNWKQAYTLYKFAEEQKPNGHVYYRLGVMYKNGHFTQLDESKSKEYFKLALENLGPLATEGDCEALCDLGSMFEYGEGVEKDHVKAVDYYLKAATKGYASAQCNLGYMYNNGRGVSLDRGSAIRYYTLASEQNHVRALYNLGYLFKYGYGVPQDYRQAVLYYRRSAEQGYTKAQHNLGFMYSNGYGVNKDKKMAAHYYKLAADQKNAMSSYNLALMYQRGEGVTQDYAMAFKYFVEATELGHKEAKAHLEKIRRNQTEGAALYRRGAQLHASYEWPESHMLLHMPCKDALRDVFLIMREIHDVPLELVLVVARNVVRVWPKIAEAIF